MEYQKVQACILGMRDWGEADRIIHAFSVEQGRLVVFAPGARRGKNRLSGSLQPFVFGTMEFSTSKTLGAVKSFEVNKSCKYIRENLETLAYASCLAELVVELLPEKQQDILVYDLLFRAYTLMETKNPRIVMLAAGMQLLKFAGYQPSVSQCAECGKILKEKRYLLATKGIVHCECCYSQYDVMVHPETFLLWDTLMYLDWDNPPSFTVTSQNLRITEKFFEKYVAHIIDKPLRSFEFIRNLLQ